MQSLNQISLRGIWCVEESGAGAPRVIGSVCLVFTVWWKQSHCAKLIYQEWSIDRKYDRQTTTQLCLIETELFEKIVRQAPYEIPDWRDQRKRKGFCEALSAQQELPQARSVSNFSSVVRKPHVPSSMAYILYALFTHVILTRLTISTLYLLPKKQTTTTGLISRFTQLESISLLFSASLFLSFYLNSWYARGRTMCGYHSYMCCPISLQRVGHIRAKGGGRAMLCYGVLR